MSGICKDIQIHAVDSKLNRSVHNSAGKETATNVCADHFVSHVNHSDDNVPVTPKESNKLNFHKKKSID